MWTDPGTGTAAAASGCFVARAYYAGTMSPTTPHSSRKKPQARLQPGCHHDRCNWDWHDLKAHYAPRAQATTSINDIFSSVEAAPEVEEPEAKSATDRKKRGSAKGPARESEIAEIGSLSPQLN